MTSLWEQYRVEDLIVEILQDTVDRARPEHHLGGPYLTGYQLAIKLHQWHRDVAIRLNPNIGGSGTGSRTSLVQYLAGELSSRIQRHGNDYPIEGAFLSNNHVTALSYAGPAGKIDSSLTGSGMDLALFRLRRQVD
jgi:hypothetical protein